MLTGCSDRWGSSVVGADWMWWKMKFVSMWCWLGVLTDEVHQQLMFTFYADRWSGSHWWNPNDTGHSAWMGLDSCFAWCVCPRSSPVWWGIQHWFGPGTHHGYWGWDGGQFCALCHLRGVCCLSWWYILVVVLFILMVFVLMSVCFCWWCFFNMVNHKSALMSYHPLFITVNIRRSVQHPNAFAAKLLKFLRLFKINLFFLYFIS